MADGENAAAAKQVVKMRSNPWILATVFLAVVIVVLLVLRNGSVSGNVVSQDTAVQNLMSFIKAQGSGTAELVSANKNGSFYEVNIKYNGQQFPVYITTDGQYLVPNLIPLAEKATSNGTAAAANAAPAAAAKTTEVPKTDKPKVEVFVMSYCPYGTQIEKGILPVAKLLGSKIDFAIKFVYYSMHGQKEIDENTRQYCIQKEQLSKYSDYLTCFLKASDSAGCLKSSGVDSTKLDACVKAADAQFNITANFNDKSTWLGGNYPKYDVYLADNQKYNVGGSPTLVINGVQASSGRDSASLAKAICAAFTTAPKECENITLSSTSPSPGFGEAAAAAASGSASGGCGG